MLSGLDLRPTPKDETHTGTLNITKNPSLGSSQDQGKVTTIIVLNGHVIDISSNTYVYIQRLLAFSLLREAFVRWRAVNAEN